jgi:hypothetical protein
MTHGRTDWRVENIIPTQLRCVGYNKLEFSSLKDNLYQVWLILASWFWRRFLKIFSAFSLFPYYLPLEKSYPLPLNKIKSPSPKDDLCQVWFKLVQWFRGIFLFVYLFVYSHRSNFSAIWRLSPLPVTGLQILAYARRSGPLSREGSLSCHTYCDTGPQFIRSHPKDRHPRPTLGFEPSTQGSSNALTTAPSRRFFGK